MSTKSVSFALTVFVAIAVVISVGGTAAAFEPAATGALEPSGSPTIGSAAQQSYEDELADFLGSHHAPAPMSADDSVDAQNRFARAPYAFWNSVPWKAVAGQWGCVRQDVKVNYSPPDSDGAASAGFATIMDCGDAINTADSPLVSQPRTRASLIAEAAAIATSPESQRVHRV